MATRLLFVLLVCLANACTSDPPSSRALYCDTHAIARAYLQTPDSFALPTEMTALFQPYEGVFDTAKAHFKKHDSIHKYCNSVYRQVQLGYIQGTKTKEAVQEAENFVRQSMENALKDNLADHIRCRAADSVVSAHLTPYLKKKLCGYTPWCTVVFEGDPNEHHWEDCTARALAMIKRKQ